ncbi:MAG: TetR/AcrR family transcriptional regulator [Gemmatimonadota bacterium]
MTSRRQQILEAFRKRLHHYGYDKTTMAEIAADLGISVGTLYLEFDSKEHILAGLMEETVRGFEEAFRLILEAPSAAPDKLRDLLLTRVELSDRCCREGAHAGEILLPGADRCRRVGSEKEARFLALLESVVAGGVEAGELESADPAATARALRDAIAVYLPPQSLECASEDLLARAESLVNLLVRGLHPQLVRTA